MLALPALAFSHGAVEMWVPAGAAVGIWLSWTVLAKKLAPLHHRSEQFSHYP